MVDILGRTGPNKFLDQEELEQREIRSAKIEGREPDFSVANLNPLLADENAVIGVPATADPNRLDVNMASVADIDRVIGLLKSRRDELEPVSFETKPKPGPKK